MWIAITLVIIFLYLLPLFTLRRMIKKDHLKTGCNITKTEFFATIVPITNLIVCLMWWLSQEDKGSNFIYGFFGVKKQK